MSNKNAKTFILSLKLFLFKFPSDISSSKSWRWLKTFECLFQVVGKVHASKKLQSVTDIFCETYIYFYNSIDLSQTVKFKIWTWMGISWSQMSTRVRVVKMIKLIVKTHLNAFMKIKFIYKTANWFNKRAFWFESAISRGLFRCICLRRKFSGMVF